MLCWPRVSEMFGWSDQFLFVFGLGAARQADEVGHVDAREHAAQALARELRHDARRPAELGRVEAEARVRLAPLEEVGVAAADVEHGAAVEDVHPVADDGAVGADQRQLAVLGRAGADRRWCCALRCARSRPSGSRSDPWCRSCDRPCHPVPEQVLVEVLGVVQVLLPRRDAGRRAVRRRVVLPGSAAPPGRCGWPG